MKSLIKLPTITNVAAGQTAVLSLPVGKTFEKIVLHIGGTEAPELTEITNIRLLINGRNVQEYTSADVINKLNQFYGRGIVDSAKAANAAYALTLWFTRPELLDRESRELTALGTADVQTASLEMTIAAAAVAPTITAYALVSAPRNLGTICKVRNFTMVAGGAGSVDFPNIPMTGGRIAAIHAISSAITDVAVFIENNYAVETPVTVLNTVNSGADFVGAGAADFGGPKRNPVTNWASVDFCLSGHLGDSLATANANGTPVSDFRFRGTFSGAASAPLVVEYLDDLARS